MPMMSTLESLAARRRTISSRCWSASVGSGCVTILYLPPDSFEHFSAADVKEPDGSLNTYQLSFTGPPEEDEPPQPLAVDAASASVASSVDVLPQSILWPSPPGREKFPPNRACGRSAPGSG